MVRSAYTDGHLIDAAFAVTARPRVHATKKEVLPRAFEVARRAIPPLAEKEVATAVLTPPAKAFTGGPDLQFLGT